jgi:hypothetical protein
LAGALPLKPWGWGDSGASDYIADLLAAEIKYCSASLSPLFTPPAWRKPAIKMGNERFDGSYAVGNLME